MNKTLKTKFGNARINNNQGYYQITSSKEGNCLKYLHRLIFEDYHGVTLLPGTVIHHLNEDKTDNSIKNLEMMTHAEHSSLHDKGENHPFFGKNHSLESMEKMSKAQKNTTGYFRVYKQKSKTCKQGFLFCYRYYDGEGKRKQIYSIDLDKLEEKVKAKNLEWRKLEENNGGVQNQTLLSFL